MATIVKRKDRYHVVHDYINNQGERKQKWKSFRTKKEATAYKNTIETEDRPANTQSHSVPQKTVQEYLDEWVAVYSQSNWKYSQYSTAKALIRNHIVPYIGDINISDVTPLDIENLYNKLRKKKKQNGECLSSTTIKYVHATLKVAFSKAVEWKLLTESPVTCKAPKVSETDITIWSDDMFKKALSSIKNKQLHLAVHLSFICSLRPGETLGLTWDCVNFDESYITINKTIQRANTKAIELLPSDELMQTFPNQISASKTTLILKKPKTKTSTRKIFIPPPLRDELLDRYGDIQRIKHYLGSEYNDYNLVFALDTGMPLEVNLCTKWFKKWQKDSGLGFPPLTFHEIRHSSSTYKLRASGGDAKSVQGDTGHAKADTLLNTYSHIEDERRANLTMTIAKDFYGEDVIDEVMSSDNDLNDDIIKRITSDPELQKRTLAALLSNLG